MECHQVEDRILEQLNAGAAWNAPPELQAHIASCPSCAAFASTQRELDARLSRLLAPPAMSPAFRSALRRRMREDRHPWWKETAADAVHFAGWGAATLVCLRLPYVDPSVVAVGGVTGALLTYVLLTTVRHAFADA
jgi:anti-sigma factor RsiW